jgi:hypothetical protein
MKVSPHIGASFSKPAFASMTYMACGKQGDTVAAFMHNEPVIYDLFPNGEADSFSTMKAT